MIVHMSSSAHSHKLGMVSMAEIVLHRAEKPVHGSDSTPKTFRRLVVVAIVVDVAVGFVDEKVIDLRCIALICPVLSVEVS